MTYIKIVEIREKIHEMIIAVVIIIIITIIISTTVICITD